MFQRDWLANNMMFGDKLTFNSEKWKKLKDYVVEVLTLLFYIYFVLFLTSLPIRNQSDIFFRF